MVRLTDSLIDGSATVAFVAPFQSYYSRSSRRLIGSLADLNQLGQASDKRLSTGRPPRQSKGDGAWSLSAGNPAT